MVDGATFQSYAKKDEGSMRYKAIVGVTSNEVFMKIADNNPLKELLGWDNTWDYRILWTRVDELDQNYHKMIGAGKGTWSERGCLGDEIKICCSDSGKAG